jgi:hypothetical protein
VLLIGNNNQAPLTATKPREVLKQVVGLQEAYRTPLAPDIGALIVFQPQYVWSLRNGAQIAKVFFTAQPEALRPLFVPTPIGVPGFNAMVYARGALNVGDVTRPTTDPTLALTNKFTQAGARGALRFLIPIPTHSSTESGLATHANKCPPSGAKRRSRLWRERPNLLHFLKIGFIPTASTG